MSETKHGFWNWFWSFSPGWFWDPGELCFWLFKLALVFVPLDFLMKYLIRPEIVHVMQIAEGVVALLWVIWLTSWCIAIPLRIFWRLLVPRQKSILRKFRARQMRRILNKQFGFQLIDEDTWYRLQPIIDATMCLHAEQWSIKCINEQRIQKSQTLRPPRDWELKRASQLVAAYKKLFWRVHETFSDLGFQMKPKFSDYLSEGRSL